MITMRNAESERNYVNAESGRSENNAANVRSDDIVKRGDAFECP